MNYFKNIEDYKLTLVNENERSGRQYTFYFKTPEIKKEIEKLVSLSKDTLDISLIICDISSVSLLKETLASMRPKLVMDYLCIIKQYIEENWGIFDDTPEIDRAIILCDAYYGDQSSVVQLCKAVNKPIMIQNVEVILENRG